MAPSQRFNQGVVPSPQELDAKLAQLIEDRCEGLLAGFVQLTPALGLQDDETLGVARRRGGRRPLQSGPSTIASGALRDFDGHLPHVLDTACMDAVRAHACRLTLAAVDSPCVGLRATFPQ